jgi:hypothetical protein
MFSQKIQREKKNGMSKRSSRFGGDSGQTPSRILAEF